MPLRLDGRPACPPTPPATLEPMSQPPPRARSGGGMFPFPHRSWQTKGGSRVVVGGCCLPIPPGFCALVAAGGAMSHHVITSGTGPA